MKFLKLILVGLTAVASVTFLCDKLLNAPRPFDKKIWNQQNEGEASDDKDPNLLSIWTNRNVCLKMFDDLKPKLIGITKKEVEQLLGTPDPNLDEADNPTDYYYLLGTKERILDTDGLWMCHKFKNDRVTQVLMIQD